eukprot:TRINITY_DN4639_c0_g1_i11.p1 TRINITY_DN4639_c0_g1~~TRINITY_DN4639_c0_g1_i11.p1  ORF type:complete len:142 (-),score=17.54 TRINITY_DN4639_c0_g1_i11:132-557(-)
MVSPATFGECLCELQQLPLFHRDSCSFPQGYLSAEGYLHCSQQHPSQLNESLAELMSASSRSFLSVAPMTSDSMLMTCSFPVFRRIVGSGDTLLKKVFHATMLGRRKICPIFSIILCLQRKCMPFSFCFARHTFHYRCMVV